MIRQNLDEVGGGNTHFELQIPNDTMSLNCKCVGSAQHVAAPFILTSWSVQEMLILSPAIQHVGCGIRTCHMLPSCSHGAVAKR